MILEAWTLQNSRISAISSWNYSSCWLANSIMWKNLPPPKKTCGRRCSQCPQQKRAGLGRGERGISVAAQVDRKSQHQLTGASYGLFKMLSAAKLGGCLTVQRSYTLYPEIGSSSRYAFNYWTLQDFQATFYRHCDSMYSPYFCIVFLFRRQLIELDCTSSYNMGIASSRNDSPDSLPLERPAAPVYGGWADGASLMHHTLRNFQPVWCISLAIMVVGALGFG